MANQDVRGAERTEFQQVSQALAAVRLRPEIRIAEVPAPSRIAPDALALTCDVVDPADPDEELATGRFVVLHDPSGPEAWQGTWRVVSFARAGLDPEVATDPVLADVGWSWLVEALDGTGAARRAQSGTVTCVSSKGFGDLAGDTDDVEMEIRASWTPTDTDLTAHLTGWIDLLSTIAGLPPMPEGVVALPAARR